MEMLSAILTLGLLAGLFGLLLGFAAKKFKIEGDPLIDNIDKLLPQTQCGQCGFPGCRPYATAIANDEADINYCPPGGETTIVALAELLGREAKPLDAEKNAAPPEPMVALIDESTCIGCTLCIQACPVDAIIGAAKQMHSIFDKECTGCELCIAPCPVDCITMVAVEQNITTWKWSDPTEQMKRKELSS